MTKAYFTENQKLFHVKQPKWSLEDCLLMQDILHEKGYDITSVSRVGCDGKYHDAWQVNREDMGCLIEQCFRQRITVEVQAEGHGKASINFCYDYSAAQIIDAVKSFQKNKEGIL